MAGSESKTPDLAGRTRTVNLIRRSVLAELRRCGARRTDWRRCANVVRRRHRRRDSASVRR